MWDRVKHRQIPTVCSVRKAPLFCAGIAEQSLAPLRVPGSDPSAVVSITVSDLTISDPTFNIFLPTTYRTLEVFVNSRKLLVLILCATFSAPSFADFRYEETTKITGGTIVGLMKVAGTFSKDLKQTMEPTTSAVLIKGNRMASIHPNRTEIIDLDKETITQIDHERKQYSVVTFQQLKQQMEEAQRKAQERAKKQSAQAPANNGQPAQMNFKVNVRNTGVTRTVSGLNANESILTLAMEQTNQQDGQAPAIAFTNDMWMAPEIPGYSEVRNFQTRMAMKMGMIFGGTLSPSMAAMQPGSAQGMAEMVKEMSKLKGVPVVQVMRMGSTVNGQPIPAASEAPLPQSNAPETPSAGEVAQESAASAIASKLGGFGGLGGFGRKKKKQEPQQEQSSENQSQSPSPTGQNATQNVLMETSSEMTGFSSAPVDASQFDVPADYKQITTQREPALESGGRLQSSALRL
jgi:hypothetical protein